MIRIYTNYNKYSRLLEADIPSTDTNNDPATEDSELEFEDEDQNEATEPDEKETEEEKKLTTSQLIVDTNNKLLKVVSTLAELVSKQGRLAEILKLLDWEIYPATQKHFLLYDKLKAAEEINENNWQATLKLICEYIENAKTLINEVKKDKCWEEFVTQTRITNLNKLENNILKLKTTPNWVTLTSQLEPLVAIIGQHEHLLDVIVSEKDQKITDLKSIATQLNQTFVQIYEWLTDVAKDFKNSFKQLHWPRKTIIKFKHQIEAINNLFTTHKYVTADGQNKYIAFLEQNYISTLRKTRLSEWKQKFTRNKEDAKVLLKDLSKLSKRLIKKQETEKTDNWQYIFDRAVKNETSGKTGAVQRAWTKYYTKEFPYMNRKVLGTIGTAFTQEINDLGFTVLKNPFIAYLKYMGKKPEFKQNIVQNPSPYIQIHNAVAKHDLTFNDLFGLGYFKRNNIIFSPDFYKKSIHDTLRYLEAQRQVETILNKNDKVPFTHAYLSDRYGSPEGRIQFFIDLFYEPGNINAGPLAKQRTGEDVRGVTPGLSKQQKQDLKQGKEIYAPKPVDEIVKGEPGGKLQPIDRIENNLTKCFTQEVLHLDPDEESWESKLKPITTDDLVKATNDIRKKLEVANPRDLDDLFTRLERSNFDPEKWQTNPPVMISDLIHDAGWRFPTLAECENDRDVLENIREHIAAEVRRIRDRTDRRRAGV